MPKMHRNPKTGQVGYCTASKRPCRFTILTPSEAKKAEKQLKEAKAAQKEKRNNETFGMSFEVAYASLYGIPVGDSTRLRSDDDMVSFILADNVLKSLLKKHNIPAPITHIGERQNPVDFVGSNGATFSLKSNLDAVDKQAPQEIGQSTTGTHFNLLLPVYSQLCANLCPSPCTKKCGSFVVPDEKDEKVSSFKKAMFYNSPTFISEYWKKMFQCDYTLLAYNATKGMLGDIKKPKFVIFPKTAPPRWNKEEFSFTQTPDSWNESNTVKYNGVSIGEFQAHNNRDGLKFRFNLRNLMKLSQKGKIHLPYLD